MQSNPIKVAILDLLRISEKPLSEYQIITHLKKLALLENEEGNLALFKLNFLVMNALYQLQQELMNEHLYLHISTLAIQIEPINTMNKAILSTDYTGGTLRNYYLDWSNLEGISEQDVEKLLNGFWRRFLSQDKQVDALLTLGLSVDADWPTIQKAYRRLAALHHPDKGGRPQCFIEIREAYEILQLNEGK